jgi:hypothetical protein
MGKKSAASIDILGARASNAGDQFHEYWALEQVLELLRPGTNLKAVTVEGVETETPPAGADDPKWQGVDCALYFGGYTLETADAVEFAQLKYSAANPQTLWTVARLASSSAKKGNNSLIRRLADDFKDAKSRLKPRATFKVRLVSNQGLSSDLESALAARWTGSLSNAKLDKAVVADLERLKAAAGLSESEFSDFISHLDFSQTAQGSRFATRARVFDRVATALGNDISSEVRELQSRIRELMLPEGIRSIVTEKDLLLWFGLSGRDGLFPAVADIRLPENPIPRDAATDAIRLLTSGTRLILIHGAGGCGKTTITRQIADGLPSGSISVVFDCFGGGRCIYSDDKRHLPENAFLQITNEVALGLSLPLFIPRSFKHPANIQTFLRKLGTAGEALKEQAPDALLLIVIDAADNSVTAADSADPKERPFVFDLTEANLAQLPDNIRFLISARTSRRDSLRLNTGTREVLCPPFTLKETALNLSGSFPGASTDLIEQFHSLSNANPRVQAYAIAAAGGDSSKTISALLPGGKQLTDVLEKTFETALEKLGRRQLFEKFIAALAYLPAPAAVTAVSGVSTLTEDAVRDLAMDLSPGLRLQDDSISIADEDFDTFIKERASTARESTLEAIADYFMSMFTQDAYAATHLADALIAAGREQGILAVIERDPQVGALGDPILRRQVQVRRLKLSLAACRHAGSTVDALKTILISAEAERDDSTLNQILESELDLSVEFGGSSLRRTILLDPDRLKEHGSFLAQDAVRAIRAGDRVTARENLYFHSAWLRRRNLIADEERANWKVEDSDVTARTETILELEGAEAAVRELMRWRPRNLPLRVADILVSELIASGRIDRVRALLAEASIPEPWDLALRIPLAMAGDHVDAKDIERSLKRLRTRFIPDPANSLHGYGSNAWPRRLLDTFITGCELGYLLGSDAEILVRSVTRIHSVLRGKTPRPLFRSDHHRLDAILRCWVLERVLAGGELSAADFQSYVQSLDSPPQQDTKRKNKKKPQERRSAHDQQEEERRNRKIIALFPVYAARIDILRTAASGKIITEKQLDAVSSLGSNSYDFDYDHDAMALRENAARSVMRLLIVKSVSGKDLAARATTLAQTRHADPFGARRLPIWRALRHRVQNAGEIVKLAAEVGAVIKTQRAAASDKVEAFIRLARLVRPLSKLDAQEFFNDAVTIAKEIDREAIDQIELASAAAKTAQMAQLDERRRIAAELFTFIAGSADRLSDSDAFPWPSAVRALVYLDAPAGLAAISKWADEGTIDLERTLDVFIKTALRRGQVDAQTALSLALLYDGPSESLRKQLIQIASNSTDDGGQLVEALSKDALLLQPQSAIHDWVEELAAVKISDGRPAGRWLDRAKETAIFLESIKAEPPASSPRVPRKLVAFQEESEAPKDFDFDPKGKVFTTSSAIEDVLNAAAVSGQRYSDRDILNRMRLASSKPDDRIAFLDAISSVSEDVAWFRDRAQIIMAAIAEGKSMPSIERWRKERLPKVIAANFVGATQWLKEGDAALHKLLDLADADDASRVQTILDGVATSGLALGSRTLFGVAEILIRTLAPNESAIILKWYATRLRARLPQNDQPTLNMADVPAEVPHAVGRFVFALMGDVDTRTRWRAAHALRRFAGFGRQDVVAGAIAEFQRPKDDAFRNANAPYYFLASRLWLLIALYRISAENPEMLKDYGAILFDTAVSDSLPHVALCEYAKRTLINLDTARVISLSPAELTKLSAVNVSGKGTVPRGKAYGRTFNDHKYEGVRFKFNSMDTLRYWYEDILRIFPTVSAEEVLESAERWILDVWDADPEANWWAKEPRQSRYDERRFGLWSNDHGSFPTLEKWGTHLEWNAMHCVMGELLRTHPVNDETGYGSFEYWVREILPTEPPEWLSDHRSPAPLESRFWIEDPRTDNGWVRSVRRDEFKYELFAKPPQPKWIVVSGRHSTYFPRRDVDVDISSALVEPKTATALLQALQTAGDPHDFRLPVEDDDVEYNEPPYNLKGWLAESHGDRGFDDRDPFRYDVGRIRRKPGRDLTSALDLVSFSPTSWRRSSSDAAAFLYEEWCDEPPPDQDYAPRRTRSDGWRVWACPYSTKEYLQLRHMDLICKILFTRQLRKDDTRSYEPNAKRTKTHKIYILRANGSVEDSNGRIGSW